MTTPEAHKAHVSLAFLDPGAVFTRPEDVADSRDFTRAEKIAILRSWQYDAAELSVAEEEGMRGDDSDLLSRVLLALAALTQDVSMERIGPTKQHALLA